MSEQYRAMRVVPDVEPVPSTWAMVGCWTLAAAFCVAAWVAFGAIVVWALRR